MPGMRGIEINKNLLALAGHNTRQHFRYSILMKRIKFGGEDHTNVKPVEPFPVACTAAPDNNKSFSSSVNL